jgi:gas vesicle protein
MKSHKHLLSLLSILSSLAGLMGQSTKKTLNYQAVILDPKAIDIPGASITGQPLNKGNVCLRFSLLNAQGGLDYEETQQVTTDEYGLVNVAIGNGTQASSNNTSIYKSFESILWTSSIKSLKVSVSFDGCNSFKQVSSQALNYTPYALYAEAVDYKNVRDAPTKLSQFSNDVGYLVPKDLDPLKADIKSNTADIKTNTSQIAMANQTIADNKKSSDAAFLIVNQSITSLDTQLATANQTIADNKKSSDAAFLIVNQSITSLDTKVAENTTAINANTGSINTINSKLSDQQNQISDNRNQITATNNSLNSQIGGLQGQINSTN